MNILTNLAYHKRKISVFGGQQLRPNLHIDDMSDCYLMLLQAPTEIINGQIYNVGFENHSVLDIAKMVKAEIGDDVQLEVSPTDDNRSYHVSSEKIKITLSNIYNQSFNNFNNEQLKAELKVLYAVYTRNFIWKNSWDIFFDSKHSLKDLEIWCNDMGNDIFRW